jgi:hypothetical protein
LNYFGEKRLLVGRIKFSENSEKILNEGDAKERTTKRIPIFLSENSLKILNKTFMH